MGGGKKRNKKSNKPSKAALAIHQRDKVEEAWASFDLMRVFELTGDLNPNNPAAPDDSMSLLEWALLMLDVEAAQHLLAAGASANQGRGLGCPPLFFCLQRGEGFQMTHEQCGPFVQLLLAHKADPNGVFNQNVPMIPPAATGETDVLQLLLEAHADPSVSRPLDGATPLAFASQGGHLDCVRLLIGARADLDAQPDWTCPVLSDGKEFDRSYSSNVMRTATALFAASTAGHVEVVQELLRHGAAPDIPIADGYTPLMIAAEQNRPEIARALIAGRACIDKRWKNPLEDVHYTLETALSLACRRESPQVARVLLEAGAAVSEGNHLSLSLMQACKVGNLECVDMLLATGVRSFLSATASPFLTCPPSCDCFGRREHGPPSPLTVACSRGHSEVVRRLLKAGAAAGNRPNAFRALKAALGEALEAEPPTAGMDYLACAHLLRRALFRCPVCNRDASRMIQCGGCKMVYFCSSAHQEEHTPQECASLRRIAADENEALHAYARAYAARGACAALATPAEVLSGSAGSPSAPEVELAAGESVVCVPCEAPAPKTFGECAICFDDMIAGEDDREALLCGHLFHTACIRNWLERKRQCPTCATPCEYPTPAAG